MAKKSKEIKLTQEERDFINEYIPNWYEQDTK